MSYLIKDAITEKKNLLEIATLRKWYLQKYFELELELRDAILEEVKNQEKQNKITINITHGMLERF